MNKENPRRCDILFGKGSDCWNHCGNKKFRRIIAKYQEKYHSMEFRSEKVALVAEIVEEIRSSGARFLRRNGESKAWEEVDRKTTVEKVGHAIRDKQHVNCRKSGSTEAMSEIKDLRDEDNFLQSWETKMLSNAYLRSILSQGQYQRMNFQLQDSITSYSDILNRHEQHLTIPYGGYATYDRNLISEVNVDRNIIPYHSYLQRNDKQYLGNLALSVPILRCSRCDDLHGSGLRRQLGERISNAILRPSRLESQLVTYLRQQAHVDTLRVMTIGLRNLRQNTFPDRILDRDGSP